MSKGTQDVNSKKNHKNNLVSQINDRGIAEELEKS
jgi:hypothetical protein